MAQLLVRNLDEKAVHALKKRARRAGRSLQAEAKAILETEARMDPEAFRAGIERIRRMLKGRKFPDSAREIRKERERR